MSELIGLQPLLKVTASPAIWAAFGPPDEPIPDQKSTLEAQAAGLTTFLRLWSREVRHYLIDWRRDDPTTVLSHLLQSLGHAANSVLALKRHDYQVTLPAELMTCANMIFQLAEELEIQIEGMTVQQVARRLSAATPYAGPDPEQVTSNDQGHLFNQAGERFFQFEPAEVLRGRQEFLTRRTASPDASSMADS